MNFHEPWEARPTTIPSPERAGAEPAIPCDTDPPNTKPWYVWSRAEVDPPAEILSVLSPGEIITDQGRRIMCTVTRHCSPEVDHGAVAQRIAACVNAMDDVTDPETWVKEVRRYLFHRRSLGDKDAARLWSSQ